MKELTKKLNKEYELIGVISINKMHKKDLDTSKINYVKDIINKIDPIDVDEPIVVAKKWDNYYIIDGYHRFKNKLINGEKTINCIILTDFKINRKNDTLFDFIQSLIGETIEFLDDETIKIEDKYYLIETNEGCGGCSSGWSGIEVSPEFIKKKIKISSVESIDGKYEDLYDLKINGEVVAKVDTGWGNGYYGGDFKIKLII